MAKSRKNKYKIVIGAQRLADVGDGKEKRPEEMTQPTGFETNRMGSRFSEDRELKSFSEFSAEQVEYDEFGHETKHPKSARETLTKRFKQGRAKHTPHPAPVQGGHYKQTPQMERPHYEETEMKTLSKFIYEAKAKADRDDDDDDKGGAKKHIIAQMRKVISMRGEHHVEFKDGKKVKLTPAIAHKTLEMHDNMNRPSDKEEFTHHIGQSIDHLKSGLKGNWRAEKKPKITLAGPKFKKEEVDRLDELKDATIKSYKEKAKASKDEIGDELSDNRARKRSGAYDPDLVDKQHKELMRDYNKRLTGISMADKKLTKEAKKDDREYGYEGEMAMSQIKAIMNHSKQLLDMLEPDTDLPEWVQSKITLAADYIQTAADYMSTQMNEEAEQIDELSFGKLAGYTAKSLGSATKAAAVTAGKATAAAAKKTGQFIANIAASAGGAGPGPRAMPTQQPEQPEKDKEKEDKNLADKLYNRRNEPEGEPAADDTAAPQNKPKSVLQKRAAGLKMVGKKAFGMKKEEADKYTIEEITAFYDELSDEHKAIFEKMDRTQIDKMITAYKAKGGKITKLKARKQKTSEKSWPASKMKGSTWTQGAKSVGLKDKGYKS